MRLTQLALAILISFSSCNLTKQYYQPRILASDSRERVLTDSLVVNVNPDYRFYAWDIPENEGIRQLGSLLIEDNLTGTSKNHEEMYISVQATNGRNLWLEYGSNNVDNGKVTGDVKYLKKVVKEFNAISIYQVKYDTLPESIFPTPEEVRDLAEKTWELRKINPNSSLSKKIIFNKGFLYYYLNTNSWDYKKLIHQFETKGEKSKEDLYQFKTNGMANSDDFDKFILKVGVHYSKALKECIGNAKDMEDVCFNIETSHMNLFFFPRGENSKLFGSNN